MGAWVDVGVGQEEGRRGKRALVICGCGTGGASVSLWGTGQARRRRGKRAMSRLGNGGM